MSSMRAATSSNLTRVRAAAPITKTRMARGGETSNDNSARCPAPFRLGLVMSPPPQTCATQRLSGQRSQLWRRSITRRRNTTCCSKEDRIAGDAVLSPSPLHRSIVFTMAITILRGLRVH
jgi:hypothetical protein